MIITVHPYSRKLYQTVLANVDHLLYNSRRVISIMTSISHGLSNRAPRPRDESNPLASENTAEQRRVLRAQLGHVAAEPGTPLYDQIETLQADLCDPLAPTHLRRSAVVAAQAIIDTYPSVESEARAHVVRILGEPIDQVEAEIASAREPREHPLPAVWPAPPSCTGDTGEIAAFDPYQSYRSVMSRQSYTTEPPIYSSDSNRLEPGVDFQVRPTRR